MDKAALPTSLPAENGDSNEYFIHIEESRSFTIEDYYQRAETSRALLTDVLENRIENGQNKNSAAEQVSLIHLAQNHKTNLIQLCLDRKNIELIEPETIKVFEKPEKLKPKAQKLVKAIEATAYDNNEKILMKRLVGWIERFTTKANAMRRTAEEIGEIAVNQ